MTALAEIKALAKSIQAAPQAPKADPWTKLLPLLEGQIEAIRSLAESVKETQPAVTVQASPVNFKAPDVKVQAPQVSVNPQISMDMGDLTKAVRECTAVLKQFLAVASAEKRIVFEGGKPVGVKIGK